MAGDLPRLETLHTVFCATRANGPCNCVGGRLTNALQAVLDLHKARDYDEWIGLEPRGSRLQCGHCADNCHSHSGVYCESPEAPYPCPTVQVITRALEAP